ncbi:MAG: tRNA glutamyl-Q(34) synthetase GluQRS [Rhodanobacteraceae bacterium]|nr:tRNA glutamyl-Q(34) synthetase GluQRS [Rhodanobacteraceae bacterium]
MTRYRGRFAPSPTGPLHLGSLLAAVASWADARAAGGQWLVRIEDIDPPREQPGASASILGLLSAIGLASDEPVLWQSRRGAAYDAALAQLLAAGLAFECRCSRSDLAPAGGIHRGDCTASDPSRAPAIRLRVPDQRVEFDDRIQGRQGQSLREEVGDFVLRRADGLYAYQLAVVVDDAAQGITDVVRGSDLLDSTPRQIWLQQCLGLPTPRYAHLPVLLGADGQKLSKQNLAPAIAADEAQHWLPRIARWLGQAPLDPAPVEIMLRQFALQWRIDAVPTVMALAPS